MKTLRHLSSLRLALTLWAHLALIPPGAWALCVGAQGHVAFEPSEAVCEQESHDVDAHAADSACDASDCHGCEDTPFLRGVALRQSTPTVDALPCADFMAGTALVDPHRSALHVSGVIQEHGFAGSPPTLSVALRC